MTWNYGPGNAKPSQVNRRSRHRPGWDYPRLCIFDLSLRAVHTLMSSRLPGHVRLQCAILPWLDRILPLCLFRKTSKFQHELRDRRSCQYPSKRAHGSLWVFLSNSCCWLVMIASDGAVQPGKRLVTCSAGSKLPKHARNTPKKTKS